MTKPWSGIVAPIRGIQALRELFKSCEGTLQERPLRREQASILFGVLLLYAFLGTGSCILFTLDFRDHMNPAIVAVSGLIILLYGLIVVATVHWRRRRDPYAFIRRSTIILFTLGLSWGVLVNLFALVLKGDQRATLVGLIMTLVSTPVLTVPLGAGLAYFIPVAALCGLAITYTLQPIQIGAALSFFGFLWFTLIALIYMNKTILERSIGRLNLQRQHETVQVFLRSYEEVSTDWLWEIDKSGLLRHVSARMAEALCTNIGALDRRALHSLRSVYETQADGPELKQCIRDRTAFRDLTLPVECGGRRRWFSLTGHPVYDGSGSFSGFRGIGCDITEVRAARNRIEFLASHDGLTGLLNRKAFVDEVARRCRVVNAAPFTLLLIDVDDFKGINDDLGHSAGDVLLCAIANRLSFAIRAEDLAGRIGGDEFAIMVHHADAADPASIPERINKALQGELLIEGLPFVPSATIGVALFPDHGEDLELLMRRADLALYRAKDRYKGTSCLFEADMEIEFLGRIRLQSELAIALTQGQLYLEYQPIFDVYSNEMVSVEALVRWHHPTRGALTAGSFIPAIEASNELIDRLGEYVLRMACRDAAGWLNEIPVAVNLSPRQLRSGRFASVLRDCLAQSGLPPGRLALEVTETVFLETTDRTVAELQAIRETGVRLVLDDFGTGYSSLTYLRGFNVDGIKIDASFTRDLPGSLKVAAIVRTIGRLASDMNIYVVAEGVETLDQLNWLRSNGIAFAQGYLLGRPAAIPTASSHSLNLQDAPNVE